MNCLQASLHLKERTAPARAYYLDEDEVVRRWFALPAGTRLPFSDGGSCQLVFTGRAGSAAGPDVHDAVLQVADDLFVAATIDHVNCGYGESNLVGDIEFHVYASDWFAHRHHSDPRYNNVILHVVLICDTVGLIVRQDGKTIPMCSLYDVVPATSSSHERTCERDWPCHLIVLNMSAAECSAVLHRAGMLRFEEKAHIFVEQLHNAEPSPLWSKYDTCLIAALAEGMGYGRDRAFFRAAGQYLLGLSPTIPEPLGHTFDPPTLDRARLSALRNLVAHWSADGALGAWETIKHVVTPLVGVRALRGIFQAVGTARADILICNCVLPFVLAVALVENDTLLAEQAIELYREYPSLSSNRITRAMSRQLLLLQEPTGACQQQGLHHIYRQTCREKRCEVCMLGKRLL